MPRHPQTQNKALYTNYPKPRNKNMPKHPELKIKLYTQTTLDLKIKTCLDIPNSK